MRNTRPGFTLVEMLVVMSVLGVLMGAGVVFLAGLMRLEGMASRSMTASLQVPRLVTRWRDDVHAARALPAEHGGRKAGADRLILEGPAGTVVYTVGREWVERSAPGPGPKVERYALPGPGSTARFESRGPLLALVLSDKVHGSMVARCEAVAALGMDLPLSGGRP